MWLILCPWICVTAQKRTPNQLLSHFKQRAPQALPLGVDAFELQALQVMSLSTPVHKLSCASLRWVALVSGVLEAGGVAGR